MHLQQHQLSGSQPAPQTNTHRNSMEAGMLEQLSAQVKSISVRYGFQGLSRRRVASAVPPPVLLATLA